MTVINFDGNNIMVINRADERVNNGVEELFTPHEFKELFGIDFNGYSNVIYEPQRNMYVVSEIDKGFSKSFNNPSEHPILKKIADNEQIIFDYLVLSKLNKEKPSPYHKIENYEYILPEKHAEKYTQYVEEREAWEYLQSTFWLAIRELELGNLGTPSPQLAKESPSTRSVVADEIMQKRREAQLKISDKFMLKELGLTSNKSKI